MLRFAQDDGKSKAQPILNFAPEFKSALQPPSFFASN